MMQAVFLAATLTVLVDGLRLRRADRQRSAEPGLTPRTRSLPRVASAGRPDR